MQLDILTPDSDRWRSLLEQTPHDIYQLPGYLMLEAARTHTLPEAMVVDDRGRMLLAPYLLRSCSDLGLDGWESADQLDAVSPYGYPGLLLNPLAQQDGEFINRAIAMLGQGLREKGVCSAFFRLHPWLNANFQLEVSGCTVVDHGETVAIDLTLPEEQLWNQTKSGHRNKINRCRRQGWVAKRVPCQTHLPVFVDIYTETMARVGATGQYFEFDQGYFEGLHQALGDRLHLCVVEAEGETISAGLYSASNGLVQALFGGTRTAFLKQSPTTLETDFMRQWAKERQYRVLHLGGGVGAAKDPLFEFKAGFSPGRWRFQSLRLVPDPAQYQALVNRRAKALGVQLERLSQSTYFPAYRATVEE
ncbi:GNAT family N-acetyltransferase [Nodosilinea sp. LEGE 07298]|uniref:GNAT family N-acetyltransferase n=1 Tax=Nodosilinea sp. LEGE 07298 TaxID=2777970 RepID=UPI00187E1042|nr:GNAT family N-acetyltransferase [Nodosilinea sp. LEGE 07298]MBE9112020.1 GNAT family N-acetyltransferase [Nodosilinea sp. LEGE 07298]